ncbi:diguanylate cyclase [Pseudogemmatithrix spongiicola]|uniref:diguanylate cyclase n=1 Tax=Pseudogemmatithrix spongiicola TaxID=3062599 RepID=A0AA49JU58_9BACT|nr:diguanylate cyclase [Gemmatimonadaceae bacterium 'strain 138']WKW15039.1 diguanylate cyclase [Gemmatimonadaceae bacterium 'strain 318']
MSQSVALLFTPDGQSLPDSVRAWLESRRVPTRRFSDADEVMQVALRGRPRLVLVDARQHPVAALKMCRRLKQDSFTGIVPVMLATRDDDASFAAAFDAGADEVLREGIGAHEVTLRLDAMLRRSDRDTFVHPSTRLPGTIEIELEMTRRIERGVPFAVCYADLDHFKEYNDRYSYYDGDRVIRILSRILHDNVKGLCGEAGFVGHIGGDDFLFIIPLEQVNATCGTIVEVFDTLIPYQYSEQDRRAGYYFGKDRRGQLHKVPLMTLSIGVVTNERRVFTHAGQVSELATEMKSYAKTQHGSVFSVDRRGDGPAGELPGGNQRSATSGDTQ